MDTEALRRYAAVIAGRLRVLGGMSEGDVHIWLADGHYLVKAHGVVYDCGNCRCDAVRIFLRELRIQ